MSVAAAVAPAAAAPGQSIPSTDGLQFQQQPMLIISADERHFRIQNESVIEIRQGQVHIHISSDDSISAGATYDERYIPAREELRDVAISHELLTIVDRLGDPSFEVRETASADLEEFDVDTEQLYAVLEQLDLSLEQRMRILSVLRNQLLHAPRGAIGIRMRPLALNRDDSAIVVVGLIAGLPAENILREDDRITQINGERIGAPDELTQRVQAQRPGDRVRLTVKRPARDERGRIQRDEHGEAIVETLEVDLTLGSADLLVDPNTGQRQPVQQVPPRRHREVSEAYTRYVNDAQEIRLDGAMPEANEDDGADGMDARVEDHTFIRHLREQLQWIEEGNMRQTRALRDQWDIRRRVLQQQIEQPNLTDDEREYLRRVLQRFEELMGR